MTTPILNATDPGLTGSDHVPQVDLPHFRSGFLRAMLAIEETGYGTQAQ